MVDSDQPSRRIGTTLRGKWTLEKLLGTGGMASVYVGRHKIGRLDAIKILHSEIASSEQLRKRFEQEAHVVNLFRHPGAVEVRDIDLTDEGEPFLVMELLDGESLSERVRRVGLPDWKESFRIANDVLDVLAAAHDQHIVHRDIKPDNLFLLKDGRIKVLDFGIARLRGGKRLKTATGTTLGTATYMAPEQALGRDIDGRADVYSVGAMLFRLLSNQRVHEGASDIEVMIKITTEPVRPLASIAPNVPADVCAIVDRALAYKVEQRYPDARTMQSDIRDVLAGKPASRALAMIPITREVEPLKISVPTEPASAPTPISEPTAETKVPAVPVEAPKVAAPMIAAPLPAPVTAAPVVAPVSKEPTGVTRFAPHAAQGVKTVEQPAFVPPPEAIPISRAPQEVLMTPAPMAVPQPLVTQGPHIASPTLVSEAPPPTSHAAPMVSIAQPPPAPVAIPAAPPPQKKKSSLLLPLLLVGGFFAIAIAAVGGYFLWSRLHGDAPSAANSSSAQPIATDVPEVVPSDTAATSASTDSIPSLATTTAPTKTTATTARTTGTKTTGTPTVAATPTTTPRPTTTTPPPPTTTTAPPASTTPPTTSGKDNGKGHGHNK